MLLLERIDRFPFFLSLEEFSYKQCEVFALYQIPCGPSILSDLGCILQSIFLSWPKKIELGWISFLFHAKNFLEKNCANCVKSLLYIRYRLDCQD